MSTNKPILQRVSAQPTVDLDQVFKALQKDGAVILENFLSAGQVTRLLGDTKAPLSRVKPGANYTEESLRMFYGYKTKRLSDLTTVSSTFRRDLLDHDLVHRICEATFSPRCGTYWLGGAEIVDVGPGEKNQPLHRDQDEWPIFKLVGPNAPEACLNFLVALTHFSAENGATRIIPGSNKLDHSQDCDAVEATIPAVMNPGDCIVLSGKTVHSAGANKTDERRLGLVLSMQCSYLTPEEAFPLHVHPGTAQTMSQRARSMVGLSSHFAKDGTGLWQGVNCTVIS